MRKLYKLSCQCGHTFYAKWRPEKLTDKIKRKLRIRFKQFICPMCKQDAKVTGIIEKE
jgi:hypothetical protein